jgi:hypothetical protein
MFSVYYFFIDFYAKSQAISQAIGIFLPYFL